MLNSKLLTLLTLFSSNILADFGGDVAVGRNHWVGNCNALCSGSEEYFVNTDRDADVNSVKGPYYVWEFDDTGKRINCDCDGFYSEKNEIQLFNSFNKSPGFKQLDVGLALESLINPVHLFYEIDTSGDGRINYTEALVYFSKDDPQFDEQHFKAYFSWISNQDRIQEFDEAVVYAAIQSAQMVMHYSRANGLSINGAVRNGLEMGGRILALFDLGSESFRNEMYLSITSDIDEGLVGIDGVDDKRVLDTFGMLIEENMVVLLQD